MQVGEMACLGRDEYDGTREEVHATGVLKGNGKAHRKGTGERARGRDPGRVWTSKEERATPERPGDRKPYKCQTDGERATKQHSAARMKDMGVGRGCLQRRRRHGGGLRK